MDDYELQYLREVMRWLQHGGGKYEPLDFEELYKDWQTRIQNGLPSALDTEYAYNLREFSPPHAPAVALGVSTEGASWAMEGGK